MKTKPLNITPIKINLIWDKEINNLDFFKKEFSNIFSFKTIKNVYIYRDDIFPDPNEKISKNNSLISS
jgi:hypothetical protein